MQKSNYVLFTAVILLCGRSTLSLKILYAYGAAVTLQCCLRKLQF